MRRGEERVVLGDGGKERGVEGGSWGVMALGDELMGMGMIGL